MRIYMYNINENLVRTIVQLCARSTRAVQMNGSTGELFRTTVWVGKDVFCHPPSSTLFSIRLVIDVLEEHGGNVIIGYRNNTNLRFVFSRERAETRSPC